MKKRGIKQLEREIEIWGRNIDELCSTWKISKDDSEREIEKLLNSHTKTDVVMYIKALLSMSDSQNIDVDDFDLSTIRDVSTAKWVVRQVLDVLAVHSESEDWDDNCMGGRYCCAHHYHFPPAKEFDEHHDDAIATYCAKKAKFIHSEITRMKNALALCQQEVANG